MTTELPDRNNQTMVLAIPSYRSTGSVASHFNARGVGFPQYVEVFECNAVDLERLRELTDEDLESQACTL